MNCHSQICGNKSGCSEFPRILTLMLAQQVKSLLISQESRVRNRQLLETSFLRESVKEKENEIGVVELDSNRLSLLD